MPSTPQPSKDVPQPGRFIVLEGLDGAGTTTQAGLLAGALERRDLRVCLTAEPTDGPIGRVLRAHVRREVHLDPHTAALFFTADRADHLARTMRPALERGEWVVCDRYLLSTLAYQGAEGVGREAVLAASEGFDVPDLTIFLEVAEGDRAARVASRGPADRYESSEIAPRLRASYEASIELLRTCGHRIYAVDGSATPDRVLAAVLARLDAVTR